MADQEPVTPEALAADWEAEARTPRAPLTADLELEGAQVRRVLAAQVRERLVPGWADLAAGRDKLAAELQGVHGELRASGIEGDPENHWAPLLVSVLAKQRDEARQQLARQDADFEARLAVLDSVIRERAEARAQHAAAVTEAGHLTVDLATTRQRLRDADAARDEARGQARSYEVTLRAIAETTPDPRAEERARKGLEVTDGQCEVPVVPGVFARWLRSRHPRVSDYLAASHWAQRDWDEREFWTGVEAELATVTAERDRIGRELVTSGQMLSAARSARDTAERAGIALRRRLTEATIALAELSPAPIVAQRDDALELAADVLAPERWHADGDHVVCRVHRDHLRSWRVRADMEES